MGEARYEKTTALVPSSYTRRGQIVSKLNKVDRLANNIQIMLKSKTPTSLCINRKNEKAFQLAVKQLGMNLDDFNIEDDGFI